MGASCYVGLVSLKVFSFKDNLMKGLSGDKVNCLECFKWALIISLFLLLNGRSEESARLKVTSKWSTILNYTGRVLSNCSPEIWIELIFKIFLVLVHFYSQKQPVAYNPMSFFRIIVVVGKINNFQVIYEPPLHLTLQSWYQIAHCLF